jgi:hypothetical protein
VIISTNKRYTFLTFGFTLLILLYHVLPVMDVAFGKFQFLGKNIFITVPVMFICFNFLFFMRTFSKNWLIFLIFLILLFCLTNCISIALFNYDVNIFLERRYFFTPIFMGVVIFKLLDQFQYRGLVLCLFFLAISVQCVFGIVHDTFFPEYHYLLFDGSGEYSADLAFGRTRETGSMISASCYAYVLLTGLMVLAYVDELPFRLSKTQYRLGLFFFLLYGITLSGSRGPIILAIITLGSMVFCKQSVVKNIPMRVFIIIISIFLCFYFGFDELIQSSVFERTMSEGSGGRYEKLLLGPLLLKQNYYLLTGVPNSVQLATTINGIQLSDNSFVLLFVTFGIVALLPIFCFLYVMWHFSYLTRKKLPVIIGLVQRTQFFGSHGYFIIAYLWC